VIIRSINSCIRLIKTNSSLIDKTDIQKAKLVEVEGGDPLGIFQDVQRHRPAQPECSQNCKEFTRRIDSFGA